MLSKDQDNIELPDKPISITIPPAWMSLIEDINYDISRIKTKMAELSDCHKKHLLPQFGMDARVEEEQTIEILTDLITKFFQQAQQKVQRIGAEGLSHREELMKKNVQSSLASQLQELSVQFRKSQQDYLQKLQGRTPKGSGIGVSLIDDDDDGKPPVVSFTADQQRKVIEAEDIVAQRTKEIKQISKSINELAIIFKDLALLVVEQGTMLDRIDYNIEETKQHTTVAVQQLHQAQEHQKGYRNKLCMLLLCIGILILLVVVLIRLFT